MFASYSHKYSSLYTDSLVNLMAEHLAVIIYNPDSYIVGNIFRAVNFKTYEQLGMSFDINHLISPVTLQDCSCSK